MCWSFHLSLSEEAKAVWADMHANHYNKPHGFFNDLTTLCDCTHMPTSRSCERVVSGLFRTSSMCRISAELGAEHAVFEQNSE